MKKRNGITVFLVLAMLAFFPGGAVSSCETAPTILFVGNSFTFGANSPERASRPDVVKARP